MGSKIKCWACEDKPRYKDWIFCKKCGEKKDKQTGGKLLIKGTPTTDGKSY